MPFEELLSPAGEWFTQSGPLGEVVVSSRLRLARNLEGRKFPHHASANEQKEILEAVQRVLTSEPKFQDLRFVRLKEISSLDRQFLTEHQLISAEHAASLGESAVAFNPKSGLSILVNEEDHLRIQVFRTGLSLRKAFQEMNEIDRILGARLPYAKDSRLGYLTACPTNLGLALRASVLIHLPAITYSNRISQVLQGVSQVGLVVRGIQGESTQVVSAFFQISNQFSLGKRGLEIVEHVERMARQMVEVEQQTQKAVFKQEGLRIQDRICRALGTLKNAKIITLQEALDELSAIRVGIEQKILTGIDLPNLNSLLILIQPAHLTKMAAKELNPEQEAVERAKFLGKVLKGVETV